MSTFTKHTNRGLLALSGSDAKEFLQSVITQDIENLKEGQLTYAAHLTPQGKYLFDFFIGKMGDKFIIDCLSEELMPLAKSLHGYVVNKDVIFENISDDFSVYTSNTPEENCMQDPRSEALGYRYWLTKEPEGITNNKLEYLQKRINLNIPENDGIQNKTLINELNFERINGVSFNKGCYVGQELTARTKFRTEPKKKLFIATFGSEETLEKGTPILSGKMEAGWLFSNTNGKGLALIRTRYESKEDLTVNNLPLTLRK